MVSEIFSCASTAYFFLKPLYSLFFFLGRVRPFRLTLPSPITYSCAEQAPKFEPDIVREVI